MFDVEVMFGSRQIAKIGIVFDELVELQRNKQFVFEREFLKLDVNLLLCLLNREFHKNL